MGVPAILGGLQLLGAVKDLFKKKKTATGEPTSTLDKVEAALDEVGKFVQNDVAKDPAAMKLVQDHELELEREYTKQAAAALNVMNTEAGSEDPWVRRARPTWLYVGMLIFFVQMVIFPFAKIKISDFIDAASLNWFYTIIGSGYLGYGVLRSADKKKSSIGGLPGTLENINNLITKKK